MYMKAKIIHISQKDEYTSMYMNAKIVYTFKKPYCIRRNTPVCI